MKICDFFVYFAGFLEKTMLNLFTLIFGDANAKRLKSYEKDLASIKKIEAEYREIGYRPRLMSSKLDSQDSILRTQMTLS